MIDQDKIGIHHALDMIAKVQMTMDKQWTFGDGVRYATALGAAYAAVKSLLDGEIETLPQWQPMATAPEATRDNPITLYYPMAGVKTNCVSAGGGYAYFLFDADTGLSFMMEAPIAWMRQQGVRR